MADELTPFRLLILNPKGGCGKTTVATNLACALAHQGHQVSLMDHDPQGSSSYWLAQRPVELPSIHAVPVFREHETNPDAAYQERLPFDTAFVVIDSPAGSPDHHVQKLLEISDLVLAPVLPSGIDFHAARQFLTRINSLRGGAPLGVIANRVRAHARLSQELIGLLDELDLELATSIRDLQMYAQLIDAGEGMYDHESAIALAERRSWDRLLDWLRTYTTRQS